MKTNILILTLLSMVISCSVESAANTQVKNTQSVNNNTPVSELFDTDMLVGCNFRSSFLKYWYFTEANNQKFLADSILYIQVEENLETTSAPPLKISGIKDYKNFVRHEGSMIEAITSYDVDVYKEDLHIMRFAKFDVQDGGLEYAGYYYILKGSPEINIPKLTKLSKQTTVNMDIETTKANNTRVRCNF